MILAGKMISFIAKFALKKPWKRLKGDLERIYYEYLEKVQPKIPLGVIRTLIIAEDHRYYKHCGVDIIAVIRAIFTTIFQKKMSGGSTIEQQLVRTVTCRYEKSLQRKVREILLASLVHKVIPKSDIPGVYLSVAYFGWQMNGIEQACKRLRIQLGFATPQQSASIIARLKYPEPNNPSPKRTRQIRMRKNHILKRAERLFAEVRKKEMEVQASAALLDI
jgi:penicillin-binding protein 1A